MDHIKVGFISALLCCYFSDISISFCVNILLILSSFVNARIIIHSGLLFLYLNESVWLVCTVMDAMNMNKYSMVLP